MKQKRKIHKDKNGREYLKEAYFVGGKMKFKRVYLIEGIPEDEFYSKNATDIDHMIDGNYWLISYEKENFTDEPDPDGIF